MDIQDVGVFDAKTRLSELLEQVARGRSYRITRRGKPIAELRPVASPARRPAYGRDRGRIRMDERFEEPLADFEGYR